MAQQQAQLGKPKTARLPLIGAFTNRGHDPSKDQRFVNMFPETRKVDQLENTKIFLNKRPGLTLNRTFTSGEARGAANFNSTFYFAIGNTVYKDGVTPTAIITLSNSTGQVAMQNGNSSILGDYLFIADGNEAWVIKVDGTILHVTSTSIHNIDITNVGAGYGVAPSVSVSGTGSGFVGSVTVAGGVVTGVTVTDGGTGYTGAPTVTIGPPVYTFNPATTVNTTTETITKDHAFATGNAVVYSRNGGTVIGGLTEGNTYYIIKVDDSSFKLATTALNAASGTAVNLTSVGTGTAHTLTGTVTATASVVLNAFPSPHVPSCVFIDGYIAIAAGIDVYTCDLDQPTQWSSSNYLSAEMFPDTIVALARQNNQVVVLGPNSIEFFYDAANAAGSPMSRNDSTTIQMGCAAPYAVYQNEQYCAYVGQSESGGRAVWLLTGFQPKKISDEYIERIIDAEPDMTTTRGYGLRTKGHLFYVINLKTIGRTLVYDIDEKLWHEWSSYDTATDSHKVFGCDYMVDGHGSSAFLLHSSNGKLYQLNVDASDDDGTSILAEITTNKYDMDTYNRKFMSIVRLVGDRTANNSINMQWSDDDYQTWSNVKVIALSDDYPAFQRLGQFRRRAFRFKHKLNLPLRLESLEVVYTEGNT